MVVILASMAILVVYAAYAGVTRHPSWWMNVVLTIGLFALHMLEIQILSPDNIFPFLDEVFFARESQRPWSELAAGGLARYNLYLIYAHLAQVGTPEWVLKGVNIPWLWIFMIQVYRMAGSSPWALRIFPVALPYMYVLSFMNMRDMLAIVVLMMLLNVVTTRLRYLDQGVARVIAVVAGLVLVVSLRPQWIVFFAASALMLVILTGRTRARVAAGVAMVAAAAIAYPLLSGQVQRLRAISAYSTISRTSEDVQALGVGEFGVASAVVGIVRQLVTPLPSSKLIALFRGPRSENLYVIELTRIVMNAWFILALAYVALHLRAFWAYVNSTRALQLLAMFAAVNTVVYGLYFFGVGSSRNKVLPILLVFLFVCHVLEEWSSSQRSAPATGTPVASSVGGAA